MIELASVYPYAILVAASIILSLLTYVITKQFMGESDMDMPMQNVNALSKKKEKSKKDKPKSKKKEESLKPKKMASLDSNIAATTKKDKSEKPLKTVLTDVSNSPQKLVKDLQNMEPVVEKPIKKEVFIPLEKKDVVEKLIKKEVFIPLEKKDKKMATDKKVPSPSSTSIEEEMSKSKKKKLKKSKTTEAITKQEPTIVTPTTDDNLDNFELMTVKKNKRKEKDISTENQSPVKTNGVPAKPVPSSTKTIHISEHHHVAQFSAAVKAEPTTAISEADYKRRLVNALDELDSVKTSMHTEKQQVSSTIKQQIKQIEALNKELGTERAKRDKMEQDNCRMASTEKELRKTCQIIQNELANNISRAEMNLREKNMMEQRLKALQESDRSQELKNRIHVLEQELESHCDKGKQYEMELKQTLDLKVHELTSQQQQTAHLEAELVSMQGRFHGKETETQKLNAEIAQLTSAHGHLEQQLKSQQNSCDFETTLKEKEKHIGDLKSNITKANQENELLRRQSIDIEAKSNQELGRLSEIVAENAKVKEQVAELESRIKVEQEKVASLGSDLQIKCTEYQNLSVELTTLKNNESKLEDDVVHLTSQLDHYKTVLERTEGILTRLQTSIEDEEHKWKEALQVSENDCETAKGELQKVYNELLRLQGPQEADNDIGFAYHCVEKSLSSIIDQMENRMKQLEQNLDEVIQERDEARNQVSEVSELTNGTNSGAEDILEKLRTELDVEKQNRAQLTQQNNKLNALIKIGQDALVAEQQEVKRLKSLTSDNK